MTTLTHTLLVILIGIASVTFIDTIGSIASRRLEFNYGWLTILSLSVYTCTGYFIAEESNLNLVFTANCIIGFYDATIGWKLSIILRANTGMTDEEKAVMNLKARLFIMFIIAFLFGYIGFLISNKHILWLASGKMNGKPSLKINKLLFKKKQQCTGRESCVSKTFDTQCTHQLLAIISTSTMGDIAEKKAVL